MAVNELTTRFVFDDKDGIKIDSLHKRFTALDSDLNNLGKNIVVGKTIANDFTDAGKAADSFKNKVNNSLKTPKDNELKTALQDIKRIQLENAANEKLITKAFNAESKIQADSKIREIRRADAEAKRSANDALRILQKEKPSILGNNSIGGFGLSVGIGAATIGISKFVDISKQAIDITVQSDKANRLLASSATEIGLSYDKLAEKNKKFAAQNALSLTQSASTVAQIARLSGATGRPQDIDKYSNAFSDLGAARGIDPKDLQTLIGTILSGQDEGLNRLGIADPSKLYAEYARSIGTTADKLTQFQKAQAASNAVVEKSVIFKGAAQDRLQSFEGRVGSLNAKVDDLTTSFSNSFTKSYEFNSGIESASKFVNNLTKDVDELQRKLANGIMPTDKDIANAAKPNILSEQGANIERGFFRFMTGFAKVPKYLSFGAFDPFAESSNRFAETAANLDPEYQKQYREDFIRQQVHAQIRLNAQQKKAAEERRKYFVDLEKEEADRQKALTRQSEFQRVLTNPYSTLSDLRENRNRLKQGDFFGKDSALSESDKLKLADDFDKAVSDGITKGFSRSIQLAKNDVVKLRSVLSQVNSTSEILPTEKDNLVFSLQQKISDEVEKGKNKVVELGKTYKSVLDDLSVRVNSRNPIAVVFAESRNEIDKLKESLKGLPKDMQRAAIESQQALNRNKLFEARIDNNLSILDLKETADKFRNPNRAEDNKKFIDEIVRGDISRGNFFPSLGGSYGSFTANKAGGFDKLTDAQKRDIYEVNQLKNLSDFNNPAANVNDRSLISRLARERSANPNENLSINERLQKQIRIINSNVSSESERSIADRKLLAASGTLDPAQINAGLREQIAAAADRQAEEKANFERKNFELEQQKLESQKQLTKALTDLTKIAEKGGLAKVELTINGDGSFDISQENNPTRASESDTANLFGN